MLFRSSAEIEADHRSQFLQKNFSKFVRVQFQKGDTTVAVIQNLRTKDNSFEYAGFYYCGFQFTVPEWLDGDFQWMWLLAKSKQQKDFFAHNNAWYIIPQRGSSKGFDNFSTKPVAEYPRLKQQFPYTVNLMTQNLDKNRLEPGRTYGIWFRFQEQDVPDIAFSMTISSDRGAKEFGLLPLR